MGTDTKIGIICGLILSAFCATFITCDYRKTSAGNMPTIGDVYIPPTTIKPAPPEKRIVDQYGNEIGRIKEGKP